MIEIPEEDIKEQIEKHGSALEAWRYWLEQRVMLGEEDEQFEQIDSMCCYLFRRL